MTEKTLIFDPSNINKYLAVFRVQDGLRKGLCRYSGPSRVSLLVAFNPSSQLLVFDPQNLLRENAQSIHKQYIASQEWRNCSDMSKWPMLGMAQNVGSLNIPGIISFGSRSKPVFYQIFLSDQHPNSCSDKPTERWFQQAAWLLASDIAHNGNLYTEASSFALEAYAPIAIRHHIGGILNNFFKRDTRLPVLPILETIIGLSNTLEEGARVNGKIIFCESELVNNLTPILQLDTDSRPPFYHEKHVRKLLQAVDGLDHYLLANEKQILGIYKGVVPPSAIVAEFHEGRGDIKLNGELLCTFDGKGFSSNRRYADLSSISKAQDQYDLKITPSLLTCLNQLIVSSVDKHQGCTIVLDLQEQPTEISGQKLSKPLDLNISDNLLLTNNLAKLDGALHISKSEQLLSFACILDGKRSVHEDRSRGARYNSAMRFTENYKDTLIVTVSEDGPVSVFYRGEQINKQPSWPPINKVETNPMTLEDWIKSV